MAFSSSYVCLLLTHKCELCDSSFTMKTSLHKHTELVHLGIRNFKCEACDVVVVVVGSNDTGENTDTGKEGLTIQFHSL